MYLTFIIVTGPPPTQPGNGLQDVSNEENIGMFNIDKENSVVFGENEDNPEFSNAEGMNYMIMPFPLDFCFINFLSQKLNICGMANDLCNDTCIFKYLIIYVFI